MVSIWVPQFWFWYLCFHTIVELNSEYSLWSWRERWTSLINVTRPPPIIIDINYLLRPLTLLLHTFLPYFSIFSHYGRFFNIINAFNAIVEHSLASSYKILLHEMTHRWGWACREDMFVSGFGKCRWSIARDRTSLSGIVSATWTQKHNQLQYDVLIKLVLPSSHGSDRCFSYIMSPYIDSLISAGLKGVASACCIVHRNMPPSGLALQHCSSPVEGEAAGGAVHPGHCRQPGHRVRSVGPCGDKYYSKRKRLDADIFTEKIFPVPAAGDECANQLSMWQHWTCPGMSRTGTLHHLATENMIPL